jgi:hypothetical protein
LVQGVHIDVLRILLENGAAQARSAQHRHPRHGFVRADAPRRGCVLRQIPQGALQQILLALAGDVDHAARRKQRVLGEAFGRMLVEGAAGARQRPDRGRAIGLDEHRGRAAGRVVTRLGLTLEHEHAIPPPDAQLIGDRCAGNARANDDVVENRFRAHASSSPLSLAIVLPIEHGIAVRPRMGRRRRKVGTAPVGPASPGIRSAEIEDRADPCRFDAPPATALPWLHEVNRA